MENVTADLLSQGQCIFSKCIRCKHEEYFNTRGCRGCSVCVSKVINTPEHLASRQISKERILNNTLILNNDINIVNCEQCVRSGDCHSCNIVSKYCGIPNYFTCESCNFCEYEYKLKAHNYWNTEKYINFGKKK